MKKMLMMIALTLMVSGCACCGLCGGAEKCCGTCKDDKAKCTATSTKKCCGTCKPQAKCGCATTVKCCGKCK